MLIYSCRCLGAAVATGDVEVDGVDAMVAKGTGEFGASTHRCGRVISHILDCTAIVRLRSPYSLEHQVLAL